jgi:hypothetical protein
VVKKNKTVLDRLLRWIRNHVANSQEPETRRKIVTNLPLLLIDDEADHGSVDTGEQVFDSDGRPDAEHQPTTINRLIRRILHSFSRSAYVGYTATPFANIFIHERGETREEGPDLFPASFIINLAAPSNYIGPARVFGLRSVDQRENELPLVRRIRDFGDSGAGWMPQKHKNGHIPIYEGNDQLPPSLVEAIDAFLLACAVRNIRGHTNQHSSMLVHVTRFNSVQRAVYRQVETQIRHLRQRLVRNIDHEATTARLQGLWEKDFLATNEKLLDEFEEPDIPVMPRWAEILNCLPDVVSDIEVRMINGKAKDTLDYTNYDGAGLKVIAIGGDKLSRGLTLEGLSISYFLRASKMYDTLMQMGRWFGYRPGYLDVCRLYTTDELAEWFGHIADAAEELREEFDLMSESGGTPRDYGLKVQSHPVLMVTSPLKMRTARNLMISFSGQLLETVALYRDPVILEHNFELVQRLISGFTCPKEDNPVRVRNGSRREWQGYLWSGVPAGDVIEFLISYKTHPAAHKVNSFLLAEFITSMSEDHELTKWTVVLIGGGEGKSVPILDDIKIATLKRSPKGDHADRYSIGRLLSPRDEAIDLEESAWMAALSETRRAWRADPARLQERQEPNEPSGPAVRLIRGFGAEGVKAHPDRGLLMIYLLDAETAGFPLDTVPVAAFGISFPGSNSGRKVEYKVNNILWEQEYGPAE